MISWIILIAYGLAMVALGWWAGKGAGRFDQFVLAGGDRTGPAVFASLLATVIGASSTLGVINLAYKVGFPAFWWLGSGALGLLVCGALLAGVVKQYRAMTLPDLMGMLAGPLVRRVISLVIAVAWIGVIAAQFIGAGKIIATTLTIEFGPAMAAAALFTTAYCVMGGQLSVFKTDKIQLLFILVAVFLTAALLWSRSGWDQPGLSFALANDSFGLTKVGYFLLVTGSGFLAGPDIISRLLAARDRKAARSAALAAGVALAGISLGITSIGLWAYSHLTLETGQEALTVILQNHLPKAMGMIVTLGLLSAILSSADTCLITAAATIGHDLLGCRKTAAIRWLTGALGAAALALGLVKGTIIDTLLLAYTLFNCGVIPPVVLALLVHRRRRLQPCLTTAAILAGGTLGIWGKLIESDSLTLWGMAASALLAGVAALFGTAPEKRIASD